VKRDWYSRAEMEAGYTVGAVGGAVEPKGECSCGQSEMRRSSVHGRERCFLLPGGETLPRRSEPGRE
jgi:hypothetical protein